MSLTIWLIFSVQKYTVFPTIQGQDCILVFICDFSFKVILGLTKLWVVVAVIVSLNIDPNLDNHRIKPKLTYGFK